MFSLEYRCPECRAWCVRKFEKQIDLDTALGAQPPCHACTSRRERILTDIWDAHWLAGPRGFLRGYGHVDDDNPDTPEE